MPRSILLGRPWPKEGEPLFLPEDTDYLIALAEEEADQCPSCGRPKLICRDPALAMAFEVHQEQCNPTKLLVDFRESDRWKNKHPGTQQATQLSVRFRKGMEPQLDHGLDLKRDGGEPAEES